MPSSQPAIVMPGWPCAFTKRRNEPVGRERRSSLPSSKNGPRRGHRPTTSSSSSRDAFARAEHHERAGNIVRATALAEEVLSATRDPAVRARAHGLVAQIAFGESFPTAIDLLEDAIRQPGAEPGSVAQLEAYLGFALLAMTDFTGALPHARRAEQLASAAEDQPALGDALALRAYIELVKDDRLDRDALRRALELEDPGRETPIQLRPLQFAATIDLLFGRIDEAQAALLALRTTILESGEEHELPYVSNLLGVRVPPPRRSTSSTRRTSTKRFVPRSSSAARRSQDSRSACAASPHRWQATSKRLAPTRSRPTRSSTAWPGGSGASTSPRR